MASSIAGPEQPQIALLSTEPCVLVGQAFLWVAQSFWLCLRESNKNKELEHQTDKKPDQWFSHLILWRIAQPGPGPLGEPQAGLHRSRQDSQGHV